MSYKLYYKKCFKSIGLYTLLIPTVIFAQKNITKDNQQWLQYYNQIKVSEKSVLLADGGYRWKDLFKNNLQYIVRMGVGYQINSDIRISIGLAHLGFYSSNKINTVEFRPYQEILIINKYRYTTLQHRFRVEERCFYKTPYREIQHPNNFNSRFRYSFLLNIPILNLSKTQPESIISLIIGDEIFINWGNEIVYNVFDQNRFLIGSAVQVSSNVTVSIIYNNQFSAANTANRYNHVDVIWLGVKQKLDFTKKREKE